MIGDLRELARGIHPPILSDRGVLEAIEAQVARLPIGVTIDSDGVGRGTRFTAEIEGGAYFFVCEGLANVLKHAAALHMTIRLSASQSMLSVAVIDNGWALSHPQSGRPGCGASRIGSKRWEAV